MTILRLFLEQFAARPFVHALGWTLLHFCWQGIGIATLLVGLLGVLRERSAQLRYIVACCALALMLVLPLLTFAHLMAAPSVAEAPRITTQNTRTPVMTAEAPPSDPWLDRLTAQLDRSLPWIISGWCLGVFLLLTRLNLGLLAAHRIKFTAVEPASPDLQAVLRQLSHRLGISRTIKLANSALVQVPTVVGWLRPVILIPVGCLMGLSASQVEAILAHELAHIRRHDYLVSVCQSLAETLLFYHPAVWWVSKQVRREREHCCDDFAVNISGDSLAYAKALSFLEERRADAPTIVLGANGGVLTMRIRRLLGYNETSDVRFATLLSVAVLATAGLGIGVMARAANPRPAIDNSNNLPARYQQWLNQEVVWIITPEERYAFQRLSADQERDQFMNQFWERRNPTPGSAANPAKDEHYRRLKYANAHFTTAKTPGWKGDRGRVYIIYGPPDEIEAHPASASAKPTELWLYHLLHIDGVDRQNAVMKFADTCSCGEYEQQFF